ncbi:MAG: DUF4156 domain-containing protein [Gammaproteobacteria bacterium]|nr:DUF4156 domain-containing protein [Gammaproteobacteria bacterium]
MKKVLPVSFAIALSACATVSPQGSSVMVVSQESRLLEGCEQLGPVSVKSSAWTKWDASQTNQQARNDLRELAFARYGADTVAILTLDNNFTSATAEGMAFKCRK